MPRIFKKPIKIYKPKRKGFLLNIDADILKDVKIISEKNGITTTTFMNISIRNSLRNKGGLF